MCFLFRIGRTGRCSLTGTSFTFFTPNNARQARELIAVLDEAGQVSSNDLIEMAKSVQGGKGGGRNQMQRFSRPGEMNRNMGMMNHRQMMPGMKPMGGGWNAGGNYNNMGGPKPYYPNKFQQNPMDDKKGKDPKKVSQ